MVPKEAILCLAPGAGPGAGTGCSGTLHTTQPLTPAQEPGAGLPVPAPHGTWDRLDLALLSCAVGCPGAQGTAAGGMPCLRRSTALGTGTEQPLLLRRDSFIRSGTLIDAI